MGIHGVPLCSQTSFTSPLRASARDVASAGHFPGVNQRCGRRLRAAHHGDLVEEDLAGGQQATTRGHCVSAADAANARQGLVCLHGCLRAVCRAVCANAVACTDARQNTEARGYGL